jgi:hypothetical protein
MARWLVFLVAAACARAQAGPPAADTPCSDFGFIAGTAARIGSGQVDLARCVAGPLIAPAPPPRAASCGNGHVDFFQARECAPCMPGHSCPCATVTRTVEQCDRRDLQQATCASLGYLGGRLACSPACTLDEHGCRVLAGGATRRTLPVPDLGGLSEGLAFPGAIAAIPHAVGVAWATTTNVGTAGAKRFEAVFAWSDPALRVMHATRPFVAGWVNHLELAGNADGWLLAASTFGDNPGPSGPAVRVFPVSAAGVVGAGGAPVARQDVLFVVRGGHGEPSLVGGLHGFMHDGRAQFGVDAWLVDDRGQPLGPPFQVGTAVETYARVAARAAYLGNGQFVVARGSTRDPAIELTIVDAKGGQRTLPITDPGLRGWPIDLTVTGDRITCVYGHTAQQGASLVTVSPDGRLLDGPRAITREVPAAVVDGPASLALLTRSRNEVQLARLDGASHVLLGAPGVWVPAVANAPDASYALAVTRGTAFVLRVR